MMVDSPGARSTMSAAARATWVAPETPIPRVRAAQRGRVVDPFAGHPHDVVALLQCLHDTALVPGHHLAEPVRVLDDVRQAPHSRKTSTSRKFTSYVDIATENDSQK